LNKLKQVKTFVKEAGHADSYESSGLTINYIRGHNPDLVMFDDEDVETERLPLNDYSTEGIHELVQSKGFIQSANIAEAENEDVAEPDAEARRAAARDAAIAAAEAAANAAVLERAGAEL
jgi:hypothetical protein